MDEENAGRGKTEKGRLNLVKFDRGMFDRDKFVGNKFHGRKFDTGGAAEGGGRGGGGREGMQHIIQNPTQKCGAKCTCVKKEKCRKPIGLVD